MNTLSIQTQIAKLRKERLALEKQEQALINKTYKEAIVQIRAIMKGAGLGLEDLVHYLASNSSKLEQVSPAQSSVGKTLKSVAQVKEEKLPKALKGPKVPKVAKAPKASKTTKLAKAPKPSSRAGIKVPIKYQHPTEPALNWSGRGKTPAWVLALKAAGELEKALVPRV
jgi:DNA-binding protein H-NS